MKAVICSALLFIAGFSVSALAQSVSGGFGIDKTRIIYNEGDNYATLTVHNSTTDLPFIVKSAVTEYRPVTEKSPPLAPFEVNPPVFRLDAAKKNIMRIKRTDANFPRDRESVYAFYAMAIPATEKPEANGKQISGSIPIAVGNRLKLFWRPAGLKGTAGEAESALNFTSNNAGNIDVYNPSAYYVSLKTLAFGNNNMQLKNTPLEMIAPFSHVTAAVKGAKGESVTWGAINDLGGVDRFTATVK